MATPAQRLEVERHKFPGMAPREVLIYRAWLRLHQGEYERFDYNVRVGSGTDPGVAFPQTYREQYIFNTQKRIDAIAWRNVPSALRLLGDDPTAIFEVARSGAQPYILEVKDKATASSMSQLLTYKVLWPATFPGTPAPVLVLITNRVSPDMPMVLDASGIRLDQVGDVDFSILSLKAGPPSRPSGG
jgi:hypothetical protein